MCEFLEYQGLGFETPPLKETEEFMGFVHSFPPEKAYLIDMPQGMKKDMTLFERPGTFST